MTQRAAHNMSLAEVAKSVDHRAWPPPPTPWIMTQTWDDLLFAHWPIPADSMRRLIPPELTLDTFEGRAWVGVVPFKISAFRPRYSPALLWLSGFLELNVRTYVTDGQKPGVFFFALDAANPLAVAGARLWFHLPYFSARMSKSSLPVPADGESAWIHYSSRRTHPGAPPAAFDGSYRPTGDVTRAEPGSLAHWLTERYCLYAVDSRHHVYRGDIHHAKWPLQPAELQTSANTYAAAHGVTLPDSPPLLHFARQIEVLFWSPTLLESTH